MNLSTHPDKHPHLNIGKVFGDVSLDYAKHSQHRTIKMGRNNNSFGLFSNKISVYSLQENGIVLNSE